MPQSFRFDFRTGRYRGHDAQAEHRAVLAQPAVQERAVARRAAGHEAAQRRVPSRRRVLAQLPALLPRRVFDGREECTSARQHRASLRVELLDLVEAAQVQHDAAEERHGLAVISRSGAPRDDRHVFTDRRCNNTHDVVLRFRKGHGVGLQTFQLLRQHRGIFKRVARQLPDHA